MSNHHQPRNLHILLADDGSEHAGAAVDLAGDLAPTDVAEIALLRVYSTLQIAEHYPLAEGLERSRRRLQAKGLAATTLMEMGDPAEKIAETAERIHPDLIVLGAKGLRATLGILLGGVAQQVVEYACCPVLIVRAPYRGLGRILLVTDGSPHSLEAVEYLGRFPLPAGSQVKALHVLPPPPLVMTGSEPLPFVDFHHQPAEAFEVNKTLMEQEQRNGEELLDCTKQVLARHGVAAETLLLRGDAATEIIAHIKEHPVDLIVAGSRGLSRARAWLLGSVSRKLIHYSGSSVLVVKSPQRAGAGAHP
jgi:nucleotide-binding universal stress UspA family protein